MKTIFTKILFELENHHPTMLATIIQETGSTPRGTGSQMLTASHGRVHGSIGGGALEHRVEQLSMDLLLQKKSACQKFSLRQDDPDSINMVCGGDVTVLMQYVDEQWLDVTRGLLERISCRQKGILLLPLDGGAPSLLDEEGIVIAGQSLPCSVALPFTGCIRMEQYFAIPLTIGERVIVFGGGHCAQALVPLLHTVGFRVTVMDQRPEFARKDLFPQAESVICGDFLHISDYVALTADDYVVVMTNGHSHDFEVQEQVLRNALAYIGVIGSRKKTAAINVRLRAAGIREEAISSVHTPIGTAIKAVTPEEIAVSIAGELIYERALRREAAGAVSHSCPMH